MKATGSNLRIGLLFHGKKIWLSELLSIIFVSILLFTLFTITFIIFKNEINANTYNKEIAALKAENITLHNDLEHLKEITLIAQTLCTFLRSRIPAPTIYKLSELIYTNSKQFGYDPLLLLAVIHVESYFKMDAYGRYRSGNLSGALGLMQLKFKTAQEVAAQLEMEALTPGDLFKPEVNIVLGVAYLTQLVTRFKSFKLGLLAYNQGPATIIANISNKQQLSLNYYRKVLKSYYNLKLLSEKESAKQNNSPLCQQQK